MKRIMALSAAIVFLLAGAAAEAVDIKLGHVGAPASPQQSIGTLFKAKVEAKTSGGVTISLFDSGTLGNERDLQAGVRSGTVDMTIAGTFSHLLPWAGILETPMLYRDLDHFVRVFAGKTGEDIAALFEKQIQVKPIFIVPHGGFRYITTKAIAVRKPADLKGLKIRNPNVPAFNIMAAAVDAVPVPLDFAELYLALDRGVVQGQHNPTGNIVGSKLYEVQDYLSMIPWGISPHVVCVSLRVWERLMPDQQRAILEAGLETAGEYPAIAVKEEKEQLDFMKDKITIITPDQIDLEAFGKVLADIGLPRLEKEYAPEAIDLVKKIMAAK
ncbi:MAG: TRAP transporter substrate-binding protein DctP [Planctomycetota bacterium]|jgi:C4-dicarboxylate-binding protein DctP|nr:TRAP transporter substrate-binding protein DctP [Planctomycetota bacterium]